jgi:hypothetical protein
LGLGGVLAVILADQIAASRATVSPIFPALAAAELFANRLPCHHRPAGKRPGFKKVTARQRGRACPFCV